MEDLTRTFRGLIILAHRANSQSLYKTATIHILDIGAIYEQSIYGNSYSMDQSEFRIFCTPVVRPGTVSGAVNQNNFD